MIKSNFNNEKIKRKYYEFMRESQGYSDSTISSIKKAIYRYEEFTDFEDFSKYRKKKGVDFKKWLEEKINPRTEKTISINTCYSYLMNLMSFLKWLCYQSGYKSKINRTEVEFLRLSKEKVRMALSKKREHYPSLEELRKVISTIKINNELDLRDRALLSFTFLSGMRDSAVISLPIGAFNEMTLQISQDPNLGVKTKFSKTINSVMFKFDSDMLRYVLDWVKYLKQEKLFTDTDPIFPKNKVANGKDSKSFTSNSVEPEFWKSATSIRSIFKKRFEDADIEYFSPHTFRHLAINTAISKCKNGQEIKAVSQNVGHENVGTTMTTYGTLKNSQVENIISGIDFSGSNNFNQADLLFKFQEFLQMQNKSSF